MAGGDSFRAALRGRLEQEAPAHAPRGLLRRLAPAPQLRDLAPPGQAGQFQLDGQLLDEAPVGPRAAAQAVVEVGHRGNDPAAAGVARQQVQQRHRIAAAGDGDEHPAAVRKQLLRRLPEVEFGLADHAC